MKPLASIIIRTFNEEKMIGKILSAVFSQRVDFPFEVIIVDSGSADDTLKITRNYQLRVLIIDSREFSFGRSLNVGCEAAQGQYLVFLSAHALPFNDDWLATLCLKLNRPRIAGVFGKQIPFEDCNPLMKRQMLVHWQREENMKTMRYYFANTNAVIRKDVWCKFRYNEKLTGSEDHEWVKRVQQNGYDVIYEPLSIVYHSHNENIQQLFFRNLKDMYPNFFTYGRKLFLRYCNDCIHNIYQDTRFILRNKYSWSWIGRSIIDNFLLFVASIICLLKSLIFYNQKF